MNPSAEQLDIMRHALGLNYRERQNRNFFCASLTDGQPPTEIWELVAAGLMEGRNRINDGQMQYFVVTPAGIKAVNDQRPPKPKQTRSQARYARYLAGPAEFMTFREYLSHEQNQPLD